MFLPAGMQRERRLRETLSHPCGPREACDAREPPPPARVSQRELEWVPCENHTQPGRAGAQAGAQCPVSKDRKKRAGQGHSGLQETPASPMRTIHQGPAQQTSRLCPPQGRPAPTPGPGVQRCCGDMRKSSLPRTMPTPAGSPHGRCLQSVNTPFYHWIKHFQRPCL